MTPSFWLALGFYIAAAAWTWFRIRPFMNRTLRAAEASTAGAEKVALLFEELLREIRRTAPPERVEKLLKAAEVALLRRPAAAPPPPLHPPSTNA